MKLPMEEKGREMSASGQDLKAKRRGEQAPDAGGPHSGWRMPGGEDLLQFALSAGLAAGSVWLETRLEAMEAEAEDCLQARADRGEK